MNPLQRTLIEKAGHDNGFEYVLLPGIGQHVALASAPLPYRKRGRTKRSQRLSSKCRLNYWLCQHPPLKTPK